MENKTITKTDTKAKKARFQVEVIKSSGAIAFKKVTIREPLVDDFLEAEKYSDSEKSTALVSLLCEFDGKKYTIEELRQLPLSDFLDLQNELVNRGLMGSEVPQSS